MWPVCYALVAMLVPEALQVLLVTAASIALVHTAVGVDHTLPFVALARSRSWGFGKLMIITGLCGIAHVGSSVVLGMIGIGIGSALEKVLWLEGARGSWASWLLVCFGVLIAARGLWRARRSDGSHMSSHAHGHSHGPSMDAGADAAGGGARRWFGPWGLFLVFLFGPCEPLIPVLMAPAAAHHWGWAVLVTAVFGAVTVSTMLALVSLGYLGLHLSTSDRTGGLLTRYREVMAGIAVAASGLAVRVLGI